MECNQSPERKGDIRVIPMFEVIMFESFQSIKRHQITNSVSSANPMQNKYKENHIQVYPGATIEEKGQRRNLKSSERKKNIFWEQK